jgi:hypothetical protein
VEENRKDEKETWKLREGIGVRMRKFSGEEEIEDR